MGDAVANDAFIKRFLDAWRRRDTGTILDAFADDGAYHAMPLPPIEGKAALREWVTHFEGVPPARLEVHHQVASDDVVMNERTDHMTLNGRSVTLPICAVFTIEDGRIKEWREYFDVGPAKAAYGS